jgi:amino acid adenylation domain-containing protein
MKSTPSEQVGEKLVPLTPLQMQFWVMEQMFPGTRAHIINSAIEWNGPLDVERLHTAIKHALADYEELSGRFIEMGGLVPSQPHVSVLTSRHDFSSSGDTRLTCEKALQILSGRVSQPFSLELGPLVRFEVLLAPSGCHLLIVEMHHIVGDGWSMNLLVQAIARHYEAKTAGSTTHPKIPTPVYPNSETLQNQVDYWAKATMGAPASVRLPAFPESPGRSGMASTLFKPLSSHLQSGIERASAAQVTTPFVFCAAVAAVLVLRLASQNDLVVGVPFANRMEDDEQEYVGLRANVLPIRVTVDEESTLGDVVNQLRVSLFRAQLNQQAPFESIVRQLNPEREPGRHPVFQVVINHLNYREMTWSGEEVVLRQIIGLNRGTHFDLEFHIVEHEEGVGLLLNFDEQRCDRESASRWAEHYEVILESLLRDPSIRVDSVPLLSDHQAQSLIAHSLASTIPTKFEAVHRSIAKHAALAPNSVAIEHLEQVITYGELDRRARSLASRLCNEGVLPGQLVPVYLGRSIDLIVAITAVMYAGAAYVPIDPSSPRARVDYILEDVKTSIVVSNRALADQVTQGSAKVLCVDSSDLEEASPAMLEARGVRREDPAYCIYTSGSTGQPKGVVISHWNIARLFTSTSHWFQFDEKDVWTLFHSQAFDFSVWEIFGALVHGGRLVVVPYETSRSPEAFADLLSSSGVTVLNQTPSAFQQLIGACELRSGKFEFPKLRTVVFGGEALNVRSLAPWLAKVPTSRTKLVNMYGITETTVHVTYREVDERSLDAPYKSPIGLPIPDLQMFLLDKGLRPVPAGVIGEIFVGGAGVAGGYFRRSELTSTRFIPNPFGGEGALYRSGDLAFRHPDGEIEYLGRADSQVKLRGHRIELGEIEACAMLCDKVTGAVVRLVTDEDGESRLVLWCTGVGAGLGPQIRDHLSAQLPPYMVPIDILQVGAFPLTVNGKLDTRQLPVPERGETSERKTHEGPRSMLEDSLVTLWEHALGTTRIGVLDNFFASGGDSIRAAQLVRAASASGLSFSILDVFTHQTIRGLAEAIEGSKTRERIGDGRVAPDLQAVTMSLPASASLGEARWVDAYPLTDLQQLMIQENRDARQGRQGAYHVQQSILVRDASPSIRAFSTALQHLVDTHPILRTRLVDEGGLLYQAIASMQLVNLHFEDWSNLDTEELVRRKTEWIAADRANRLGATPADPLVRFAWFARAVNEFEFLMSIHHAIDDGWGNQEFLKQLFELYAAYKEDGRAHPVHEVQNVFKEYVALECNEIDASNLKFWQNQNMVPVRLTGASSASSQVAPVLIALPAATSKAVRTYARATGVSLKAVYLQTFIDLLSDFSGQSTLTLGVVTNGRTELLSDPFKALGLFWRLLPVTGQQSTCTGTVKALQSLLGAIEDHSNIALSQIAKLKQETTLFDATFNFVSFNNQFVPHPTLEIEFLESHVHDRFHFPLNLMIVIDKISDAVRCHFEYDERLFSESEIQTLGARYAEMLGRLGAQDRGGREVHTERAFVSSSVVEVAV